MKQFFTLFLVLLIFSLSAIPAFAIDGNAETVDTVNVQEESGKSNDENIFSIFYSQITEHLNEILCALTVVGTGILAFAYKKGLLPLVTKSLGSLVGTVGSIKENTESEIGAISDKAGQILSALNIATNTLSSLGERMEELRCDLDTIQNLERSEEAIRIIMRAQVDTLSDIFMTSALPEYRKAEVGERIQKMKEELSNVTEKSTTK